MLRCRQAGFVSGTGFASPFIVVNHSWWSNRSWEVTAQTFATVCSEWLFILSYNSLLDEIISDPLLMLDHQSPLAHITRPSLPESGAAQQHSCMRTNVARARCCIPHAKACQVL